MNREKCMCNGMAMLFNHLDIKISFLSIVFINIVFIVRSIMLLTPLNLLFCFFFKLKLKVL
jgi:hypothetical protein